VNKNITVGELAKKLASSVKAEALIDALKRLGIHVANATDTITGEQEKQLLDFLKNNPYESSVSNKISLKRRSSVSQIKIKSASGANSTVSVVRKNRRIYVKEELDENKISPADKIDLSSLELTDNNLDDRHSKVDSVNSLEHSKVDNLQSSIVNDDKQASSLDKKTEEEKITTVNNENEESSANKPKSKKDKKDKNISSGVVDEEEKNNKKHKTKSVKDKEKILSSSKINVNLLPAVIDEDLEDEINAKTIDKAVLTRKIKTPNKLEKSGLQLKKRNLHAFEKPASPIKYQVELPVSITVAELAQKMSIKSADLIKAMIKMGIMVTINQTIDQETACLIVEEMGHAAILSNPKHIEDSITINYKCVPKPRPAIVTVMGHVDHGKTSLLDYIRNTRVTAKEAGGITQHIGAYQVHIKGHGNITFLDTPGHSAFSAMRARGANCTDIVVLVVAADDSVMPQTIEAIQHAKAASVPIIVAINKMDKPDADPTKVISDLSQHGIIPEDWGGDNIFVKISAKTGMGVDNLLEAIILQAEMLELTAPYIGPAQGVIIESSLDKSRGGIVATLLVQSGTLKKGDIIIAGLEYGKIKSLKNDQGLPIEQASPCVPVEVLGLSYAPLAGDKFQVVPDEKKAKEVTLFRNTAKREEILLKQQSIKFSGFIDKMQQSSDLKTINIVLKADVQGSLEAISDALEKLSTDKVKINIIGKSVGGFNESDVNLALASGGFLLGFNVRAEMQAKALAKSQAKQFNYYSVIYDLIDAVKEAIKGNTVVPVKERIIGVAEVREVFKSSKFGTIAGCIVKEGLIKRGNPIRVLRDNIVIYSGELESLRRFKENVNEARSGMECGIGVQNYSDVKVNDQIEVFEVIITTHKPNKNTIELKY
jgi:translation initiation factor IF-2